jgi:hypothetical protein
MKLKLKSLLDLCYAYLATKVQKFLLSNVEEYLGFLSLSQKKMSVF